MTKTNLINNLLSERFRFQNKSDVDIFYDLVFCILVPGCKFKKVTEIVDKLKENDFYFTNFSVKKVEEMIKTLRFWKRKARYLKDMRYVFPAICQLIKSEIDWESKRGILVRQVGGLGMKAASHFLRNMGARDLAILDVHILRYLKYDKFRMTIRDYLRLEEEFRIKAKEQDMGVAELDALIWARESGTPLKEFNY